MLLDIAKQVLNDARRSPKNIVEKRVHEEIDPCCQEYRN